jgi:hypothetical protein
MDVLSVERGHGGRGGVRLINGAGSYFVPGLSACPGIAASQLAAGHVLCSASIS